MSTVKNRRRMAMRKTIINNKNLALAGVGLTLTLALAGGFIWNNYKKGGEADE